LSYLKFCRNWFSFRNEAGYELSDAVGIIVMELTKLDKTANRPRPSPAVEVQNFEPLPLYYSPTTVTVLSPTISFSV
jgi:hypothetical protein